MTYPSPIKRETQYVEMHYLLTVCGTKTLEDFPGLLEQLKLVEASVKLVGEVEAPPPEDLDALEDVKLLEGDICTSQDLVIDIDLPIKKEVDEVTNLLDRMTIVDDSHKDIPPDPQEDLAKEPNEDLNDEDLPHRVSLIVTLDACTYTEGRTNLQEWLYHLAILTDTNCDIPTFEIEKSTLEPFTYKGFIRHLLLENWGITKKDVGYIRHAFTEKNVHAYVCNLKNMGKTTSIPTDMTVVHSVSNPPTCWKHLHLAIPYSITPSTMDRHRLSGTYPKLEFHFGPVTYSVSSLFDVLKTTRK